MDKRKSSVLTILLEVIYIGVVLYFFYTNADGQKGLFGWFIDGLNIAAICVAAFGTLIITGLIKDFFSAFQYFVKKPEESALPIKRSLLAVKTFIIAALLMNMAMVIVRLAAITYNMTASDLFNQGERLTPLIAWLIADAFPGLFLAIIVYPIYVKLKKTEIENE